MVKFLTPILAFSFFLPPLFVLADHTFLEDVHTDHLSGSNAVTNDNKELIQLNDYFPFGELRIDNHTGNFDERKKFTGYELDRSTGLNYAGARYQNPKEGRFISQDPVFQNIGADKRTNKVLEDPQLQNSYSYARNNPLILKDDSGKLPVIAAFAIGGAVANVGAQGLQDIISGQLSSPQTYIGAAVGGAVGGASLPFTGLFGSGAITAGISEAIEQGVSVASGQEQNFNPIAIGTQAVFGGVLGRVSVPGLQGITKGANSYSSIFKQILTKYSNESINNVSQGTLLKIGALQSVDAIPEGIIRGVFTNPSIQNFVPHNSESRIDHKDSIKKEDIRSP